jgi:hypothetical protein
MYIPLIDAEIKLGLGIEALKDQGQNPPGELLLVSKVTTPLEPTKNWVYSTP